MKSNTIFVVISDTHIGSTTALAPPKFEIKQRDKREKQVVEANRLQRWLWECWTDYWEYIHDLAGVRGKHRKHRIVVTHLGDVIDGNHLRSLQVVQEISDQIAIAIDVLSPIAEGADAFYGILGTEVHANKSSSDEARIYREIGAVEYDQHLPLNIDGLIHDCAHRSRIGLRPWTSAAAGVAVEVILEYANLGAKPPDFVWRGHNHKIDDSGDKIPCTRAISVPSWQLKNSWSWGVAANQIRSDIGGYIVNCGEVDDSHTRYRGQPDGLRIIEV